jgi:hypothetical protein
VREIRTLRAMWRGLETTYGSDTEALSTETERQQTRPNLRSIGANPRPYRASSRRASLSRQTGSRFEISFNCCWMTTTFGESHKRTLRRSK